MATFKFIPLLGLFVTWMENLFYLANGNSVFFSKCFFYVICLKILYLAAG